LNKTIFHPTPPLAHAHAQLTHAHTHAQLAHAHTQPERQIGDSLLDVGFGLGSKLLVNFSMSLTILFANLSILLTAESAIL